MIERTPCAGPPAPGSTFRPLVRFSAGGDEETASVVIGTAEVFERRPHEYLVARWSWRDGAVGDAVEVVSAALAEVPEGSRAHLIAQHASRERRRAGFSADGHPWHKWHYRPDT